MAKDCKQRLASYSDVDLQTKQVNWLQGAIAPVYEELAPYHMMTSVGGCTIPFIG